MTMKNLFDKDMWDRLCQEHGQARGTPVGATESARQLDIRTGRAGEPMMTNWARGGGGPEEVISRHRPDVPQPAFSSPMQPEGALGWTIARYPQTRAYK